MLDKQGNLWYTGNAKIYQEVNVYENQAHHVIVHFQASL